MVEIDGSKATEKLEVSHRNSVIHDEDLVLYRDLRSVSDKHDRFSNCIEWTVIIVGGGIDIGNVISVGGLAIPDPTVIMDRHTVSKQQAREILGPCDTARNDSIGNVIHCNCGIGSYGLGSVGLPVFCLIESLGKSPIQSLVQAQIQFNKHKIN
eukprot:CAMPEP_0172190082 /NCGR_PEP_ID=MMETSP1050-20130122/22905_1 /TAXON_ID=233186 /ORGANISM="Cryptomonas curvata, Strain CCAP979/52" /LENGTH=153 /DNA_ID=CAMNT_0012864895 /DNA_START=284 /DNA_END=742 /DNA_ORIENTATION=-